MKHCDTHITYLPLHLLPIFFLEQHPYREGSGLHVRWLHLTVMFRIHTFHTYIVHWSIFSCKFEFMQINQ